MVPTSHLSKISFYSTSRSTDIWVSTRLASSILLAISALFFHREPSAGTHGVIVFALVPRSRAPCARQRALPVSLIGLTDYLNRLNVNYFNRFKGKYLYRLSVKMAKLPPYFFRQ